MRRYSGRDYAPTEGTSWNATQVLQQSCGPTRDAGVEIDGATERSMSEVDI